jgi:putative ABC transport system permease protein
VVLTDEVAAKYFGTTDVLGKLIEIDAGGNFESYKVTGVVKTPPMNSSIRFDVLRPFVASLPPDTKDWGADVWTNRFLTTFLLLRADRTGHVADPAAVEHKFAPILNTHARQELADIRKDYGAFSLSYHLQPYEAMHLDPDYGMNNGLKSQSSSVYSYILGGIAGLILLIAGINFVNLTLARSLRRGKEIGVRKVSGSTRAQLVGQFLGESLLLTLLAFIPAVLLVYALLPQFSTLANKQLQINFLFTPQTIGLFVGLALLVALLAGAYPAVVLSGFSPVQTLYGRFKLGGRNWLGKSLVVVQFAIAVFLLIGTAVLQGQFQFIRTANVGYETANRVRVYIPWGREQRGELLQATLRGQPGVQVVARKSGGSNFNTYKVRGKPINSAIERIDDQYLNFINVPVVQGRALSYANAADTLSNVLVNETFAKKFLAANQPAVGQVINADDKHTAPLTVVGVVRDYQYGSLRDKLEPILWQLGKPNQMNQLYAKLDPTYTQPALQLIEKQFKTLIPMQPFDYHFMEDDRLENYADDARWTQLITWSSGLAILISALGLFGLVSLTIEQRTKEIGIRKVLGANIAEITRLLSVNFLTLIGLSCLIAMPVGWYAARHWLDTFVFRMDFGWWIFALTGVFVLLVAGLTISIQAIRAALMNPVKSLRSE